MHKNLIVTVNYHNYAVTRQMIESYMRLLQYELVDLIIVDNMPEKSELAKLADYIKQNDLLTTVKIVESDKNLGYFGAFKYALNNYVNINDYQNIIISNNDILFKDTEFFNKLNAINFDYHILAPSIRTMNKGIQQNPHSLYPPGRTRNIGYKFYFFCYCFAYLITVLSKIKSGISANRKAQVEFTSQDIYSPHGAFIIFNQKYFRDGGYIDTGYFLYGEEASVAAIAKQKSFSVIFYPELEVIHNEHQSTNFSILSRRMYRFQKESYIYINNKYGVYKNH